MDYAQVVKCRRGKILSALDEICTINTIGFDTMKSPGVLKSMCFEHSYIRELKHKPRLFEKELIYCAIFYQYFFGRNDISIIEFVLFSKYYAASECKH